MDNPGGIGNIQPMTTPASVPSTAPQSTTPASNGNQRCACGCQMHGQGQEDEPSIWTRFRSMVWNGTSGGHGSGAQTSPEPMDVDNQIEKPKQEAVALIEKELKCGICLEVMIQAVGLECGHHFCELCILTWLKDVLTCPLCHAKARKTFKAIHINNLIDEAYGVAPKEIQAGREALVKEREQTHRNVDIVKLAKEVKFIQSRIPLTPPRPTTSRIRGNVAAARPGLRLSILVSGAQLGLQPTSTAAAVPITRARPLNPATVQQIIRQHSRAPAPRQRFPIHTVPTPPLPMTTPTSVPSTAPQSTDSGFTGNRRSIRLLRTPATDRPSATTPTTTSGQRRRNGISSTPTGSQAVGNTTGRRGSIRRQTPGPQGHASTVRARTRGTGTNPRG